MIKTLKFDKDKKNNLDNYNAEVIFVTASTAGDGVNFLPAV